MSESNYLILLEKLSDLTLETAKLHTKVDMMGEDIKEIREQDITQNQLLAEHIAGVETQKARLDIEKEIRERILTDLESRLKDVELPQNYIKTTFKVIGALGALAAAIFSIYELWGRL